MNQKNNITRAVLEFAGLTVTEERVKKTLPAWWANTRTKDTGGLRLTDQGFDCLSEAGVKSYKIEFENPVIFTNQLIIWLDNFMDCPYYLTNMSITVFSERKSFELMLFSDDIRKFGLVKAMNERQKELEFLEKKA
jgi:hypothetical protein